MKQHKETIITITYNDLSIAWGPAVHYLELWNSFYDIYSTKYTVIGFAPTSSGAQPIISPHFDLRFCTIPKIRIIRNVFYELFLVWQLWKYRKALIYLRKSRFHVFTILASILFRVRLLTEFNGISSSDLNYTRHPMIKRVIDHYLELLLIRISDGCIAVTKEIGVYLRAHHCKKLIIIPNGVATSYFAINRQENINKQITIIYVGTFTAWDGAKFIPILAKSFPDIRFMLVGEGPFRKEVELEAPANVIFTGEVPYAELPIYYEKASAGIGLFEIQRNTSTGSSSLKTREYIASGLPVFTTRVPGQENVEVEKLGVRTDFENLEQSFSFFLENIKDYTKNVLVYRKSMEKNMSWNVCAVKTKEFIDYCFGNI